MGELFDSWLRKFEEDGEEIVRMKIAVGVFSQTQKETAEGWLKSKAVARQDQSRRDTLASQAEASSIARDAAAEASRAVAAAEGASAATTRQAAAAEEANRLAIEANRIASSANRRATIAIAISIATIVVTILLAIADHQHWF
jgi:hypothetical protein